MEDEEQRKAFIGDEANLDLAINDAVEVIRALLRALAAKDPGEQARRALAGLFGCTAAAFCRKASSARSFPDISFFSASISFAAAASGFLRRGRSP